MIYTTKEGWRLEIKAFQDPEPRLYICTGPTNVEGFTGCTVNGVQYYVTAHLYREGNTWTRKGVSDLHMSRAQWRGKTDDWTWPARRKLEARLIEIAAEWYDLWHGEFDLARREYRSEQIEKRETKIAELTEEINKLRAELAALQEVAA